MTFWQKLTIDWPCALGDWLWAMLVVALAAWLERLTWRQALRLVATFAMLVVFFYLLKEAPGFIGALDLGFLFTLDATVYWEAGALLMLLTARGLSRQMLETTARLAMRGLRAMPTRLNRFARRARRSRAATSHMPPPSQEDPGLVFA
jgi:hypothetical protein